MEKHYNHGLLIGRFQPFHNGHAYLLKKAYAIVDHLTIAIGSVNKETRENPFSFTKRKEMLEAFLRHEHMQEKAQAIVPLADNASDALWLENLQKNIRNIDVVIGNNDWVNGIFEKIHTPILRVPYYKRYLFEGQKIRQLMQEGKKWEDRVPEYLADLMG